MIKIPGLREVGMGAVLAVLAVSVLGVATATASEVTRVIVKFPDTEKVIKLEATEVEIKKDDLGIVEEIRLRSEPLDDDEDELLKEDHGMDLNEGPGSAEASESRLVIVKFPDKGKVIKIKATEVEIKKDDLGMIEEIRLRSEPLDD